MMPTYLAFLLSLSALCPCSPHASRAPETRAGFVTTLGRDTVALESFTRSAAKLEGDLMVRVPGTVRFHYALDLRDDGSVSRSVVDMEPLGLPGLAPNRVTLDFLADSVRIGVDSAGHRTRATRALAPNTVPFLMTGFESYFGIYSSLGIAELLVSRMPVRPADTMTVASIGVASGAPTRRKFMRRTATSADVDYFMMAWTHLTTDEQGHILAVDMSETTEKTRSVRTEYFDVERLATQFAERDRAGKGVGMASPTQKVTATIGGSPLFIGYSSPKKRGREILGQVVPFGQVWRTGANEATVLITDRDITIGDAIVPAGSYSLWTLPTATGVQLIVNGQSGQWGTSYDPAKDLVRMPMQVRTATAPQEDFTIALIGSGNARELRMAWDTFVWSVPLAVK
jgi:hypothetical protein